MFSFRHHTQRHTKILEPNPFPIASTTINSRRYQFLFRLAGCIFFIFTHPSFTVAAPYTYLGATGSFSTAIEACTDIANNNGYNRYIRSNFAASPIWQGEAYNCYFDVTELLTSGGTQTSRIGPHMFPRYGDSCGTGTILNITTGQCATDEKCIAPDESLNVTTGWCGHDEQKGTPPAESCFGNPINIAVGNKFQRETDFQSRTSGTLNLTRSYNSLDGVWRHNYSTLLRTVGSKMSLVHADGRESYFTISGDIAIPYPGEFGSLTKTGDTWTYVSPTNEIYTFDSKGRLTQWTDAAQRKQNLTYINWQITVTTDGGETLTITEDAKHQPLSLTAPGTHTTYSYDNNNHLTSLVRNHGTQTEQRLFHYEDSRNTNLLTGITDERGIRYATWTYDDKSRATSSQHSGGAGLIQVSYNDDGSNTVTTELGKQAIYRYQKIGGVRKVASIEGEPTPDCPASNSSYTYNDRGSVLTKTDAKGYTTAYTYNDRELEVSRTEASGTPLARTITTEWDPVRSLPTKVVEQSRTTSYTYDDQGREIGREILPR